MILRNVLVPGVVVPAVATAVVLLLLRSRPGWRGGAGLALAAGFLASFVALSGWPSWPPVEATQRLFFVVAAAGAVSWLLARGHHRRAEALVEITAGALMPPLILWALVEHTWSPVESAGWFAALFLGAFAVSRALGANLENAPGGHLSILTRLALIVGVATALGLSESFRLALLAGALACCVGVVELFAWRRHVAWRRSDAVVISTSLGGLLLVGHFYAALAGLPAVLIVLALLLLWLPRTERRWLQLAPLLPLLVALGLVIAGFLQQEDDYYDYSHQPTLSTIRTLA